MTSQVVDHILPDRRRAQHLHALGKAQRFTDQASIHVPRGQIGAFNVGRVRVQCSVDLLRVAKDHTRFDSDHTPLLALLDHLQILPILSGLFERGRTPASAVVRHVAVHFNQRFPVTAPAVRHHRRRGIGMSSAFELV